VVILAVPREDSFLAIFALFFMVFRREAIRCGRLKESIRICREHPLITRSDQWFLCHHLVGSDLVGSDLVLGLESGGLFRFGVSMDVVVAGFPKIKKPFQRYFYYTAASHMYASRIVPDGVSNGPCVVAHLVEK